jgi:hypothetical protein
MKTLETFSNRKKNINICHAPLRYVATALAVFGTYFVLDWASCRAEPSDTGDEQGVQVLTRGPVHEAFAGIVTFNPEPGVEVPKAPPELIEELPPDERPEGANVTWIPGYWAWDDERNDFLWVSGVWRALPPGRQWVAGYWAQSRQGFQWTSGYWADARVSETTYLPAPPATVEVGPNIAAPSEDYGWTPGCWVWFQGRYAWRPGYWVVGRSDWDWSPAYYVWTPRGYVFVDGYWDYSVERRGVLFAPVYFESGVYARRGYRYSPTIVIGVGVFSDHLFLRPRYHHYYFGDYYAASYYSGGFYASFSFQSGRYGYDPIYAHQRWEHRQDREWEHHVQTTYEYRRDHEDARPPRTWVAERSISASAKSKDNSLAVATSLDQLSKRKDSPMRFQPVAKAEKQQLAKREQEVSKSRDQRRTLEASPVDTSNAKPGKQSEPSRVKLPKSPIVAKSSGQLGKGQAPPSPHKTPKPDSKVGPKPEASTPEPNVNNDKRQSEPPKPETKREAKPEGKPEAVQPSKHEAKPESRPVTEQPAKREAKPEAEQPSKHQVKPEAKPEDKPEAKPEAEKHDQKKEKPTDKSEKKSQPESKRPAKEKQAENEKDGTNTENKDHKNKGEE